MNVITPLQAERLFTHFIDDVDGVVCLSACATAADIHAQAAAHRLRFPLMLDASATLVEQINASTFAPASCRFGPYCDNVLGMNWRLPDGRVVRIGERVVKTTTGYDWLRFLLHTGIRFGEPLDYVLRLRPDCGHSFYGRFDGAVDALRAGVSALLHSGWMHWWESVDFVVEEGGAFVRVAVHCPLREAVLFADQLRSIATAQGLRLTVETNARPPADCLPDLVFKTTPDRALTLASELSRSGVRCMALCYNGVVHVWLPETADRLARIDKLVQPHLTELHALGGDWHSRHLLTPAPTPAETVWLKTLEIAIHDH